MKDLKHIRGFNESDENLNISDVSDSELKTLTINLLKEINRKFDLVEAEDYFPTFGILYNKLIDNQ